MEKENKISVALAAKLLGASEQFIRVGLQRKELPFGYAVRPTNRRWAYVIPRQKFEEETGIKVTQDEDEAEIFKEITGIDAGV